ncbi:cation-binding protein [Janibacter sp. Soil728]|uniref:hemerythrin domain-containing protein n=1 Tax=Janibacter sp. Soil728 TaxID=1736393 RepID=UPI0006F4F51D|nr:hemerythrin domain-containing protein [Janibacter sp. Soil728]KRE39407.1 cation-binding protein [Janibacter sp. Soil728]
MTEGEQTRLVAWAHELRAVHARLREALDLVRAAGEDPEVARDLLVYCRGFCTALTRHHEGEDRHLFPAIASEHPELADTLRRLSQDHSMMSHLVGGLEAALDRDDPPERVHSHLDGLGAIMESHFRFEERALLRILETLDLDADPADALGPL